MKITNSPRQKMHRDERRKAIIQGAAHAFVEHGYEATGLDEIAREAGVSRVLLYRHFDSKKALYRAILEDFRSQLPLPAPGSNAVQSGAERLNGLIHAAQADPDGFRLTFRHAPREPEFRSYFEEVQALRFSYLEHNMQELIPNKQQRNFVTTLLRDIVTDTLLTWIDAGQPRPEALPAMIRTLVQAIVTSAKSTQN
jgi:AcrR family transcriptional regulator